MSASKKDKKRENLDVRPIGPLFRNYDYGGPEKATETSPGRGLYNGPMDKYKSVKDFVNKKRKDRKALRRKAWLEILLLKTAQETTTDTSLVDGLRSKYGPGIQKDIETMLSQENAPSAVSSIPIRVFYENGKVVFQVQSTGKDSARADILISKHLNSKYAVGVAQAISKVLGGKSQSFNFGLITLEFGA